MLYEVVLRERRIVRRTVQVEAAERVEARTAALDPDKWLKASNLPDDIDDSELEEVEVESINRLRRYGESA